jgi:uncharacterized protein (DUF934 family)
VSSKTTLGAACFPRHGISQRNAGGAKLLSLAEALEQAQDNASFGVVLQPADDVRALATVLDRIAFVALTFPAFSDGRAFSQAMLLGTGSATKASCAPLAWC